MRLLAVIALAIALQSGLGLWLAGAAIMYVCVVHRARFFKLLRRVRLLVIVLFSVTLLMTPGAALWPQWGLYPTIEGVSLAMTQLLRLLGMLAAVSWLLDTADDRALAAGSLALLQPLAGKRQWPARAVARLLLVFHYLETAPKPRHLNDLLALAGHDHVAPLPGAPTALTLGRAVLTRADVLFGLVVLGLATASLAIGAPL